MLNKFKTLFWSTACMVTVLSCMPEEFGTVGGKMTEINPEYAVPLISDDLSIDDIVKNSIDFVKIYNDNSISFVYRGEIFSSTAGDAVTIPNQNFNQTLVLNSAQAAALAGGQSQTISLQSNYSFALGSREIDSIWLKAGSLVGSVISEIKTGGNLKITFEDAKNLTLILSVDVPFNYGGSIPVLASKNTPLPGYKWDMTKGGLGYNNVNVKFDLTLNPTTEPVAAGDKIDIGMGFNNMKFSRFYGYIGQVNLANGGDTIDLSVFDNEGTGQFFLEDPKVKIICGNSFGVPVKAGFTKLAGYSKGPGGFETNITGNSDPLPVPTPTVSQIGEMLYDSVVLDKTTSNIKTVINQKPKQIIFQTYINLNPLGRQQRNFITDYSRVKFIVDVEMPLYGSARNFVLESEDSVSFKAPEEDLIENILFRFTGNNGYPIDLITQVYLIDSLNNIFDSIFPNHTYQFLEAANVGTDGKVTTPSIKTTDVEFDMLRAKRLNRLKKIKLRAEIATTSAGGTYPSVKLYNNYVLGIKIGVKAKLKLKVDKF